MAFAASATSASTRSQWIRPIQSSEPVSRSSDFDVNRGRVGNLYGLISFTGDADRLSPHHRLLAHADDLIQ